MVQTAGMVEPALTLDETERSRLVEALTANLYGRDVTRDWEEETQHRVSDVDSGRVHLIPGDEVFAQLRSSMSAVEGGR